MRICGLKLTHDGAIAVIENGKLLFSIEMEKVNNNPRYTAIEDTSTIEAVLASQGLSVNDIDHFAIDGWGGYDQEALAIQPRLEIGEGDLNKLSITHNRKNIYLDIAQYHERTLTHNVMQQWVCNGLPVGNAVHSYSSFLHVTGHVMSAYCSSPFAARGESSYVLVWDGGMYPRLYFVDAANKSVENMGPVFLLIGNIYTIFSQHFGPFKVAGGFAKDSLSVAGKVMAYIALGQVRKELYEVFDKVYEEHYNVPMGFANIFAAEFSKKIEGHGYSDEDILCSFHHYLGELLVSKLQKKISRFNKSSKNICFAGGCALNIKWNSDIRESKLFDEVYVPPFPNDSGSAIGAACAYMWLHTQHQSLEWDVYAGPALVQQVPETDWAQSSCSPEQLALLLHTVGEPVVFLNERAELGPRALGNRSILAPAVLPEMKDVLNYVKKREPYRPVSPICLEDAAAEIFDPGCSDPYMLFDHQVKPEWMDRIPAICHLDGSARLQTTNEQENPVIAALLRAYYELSGIPLLCNTSANHNGSGFFPSVSAAADWGRVNYVWSDGYLYERNEKIVFMQLNMDVVSLH
ncbi:MAG: carbamoyltransferase N-terminal domain-containing protein [Chitinophagaceae bacterium]